MGDSKYLDIIISRQDHPIIIGTKKECYQRKIVDATIALTHASANSSPESPPGTLGKAVK